MPPQLATDPSFNTMVRHINKMMDQVQKGFFSFCPSETWTPDVNVYETEKAFLVCVDVAGVDKGEIDVQVVDNQLRLRGQRAVPSHGAQEKKVKSGQKSPARPASRCRVHLMEIDHGPFCRAVDLPQNVHKDKIKASYKDGLLWVELPKTA